MSQQMTGPMARGIVTTMTGAAPLTLQSSYDSHYPGWIYVRTIGLTGESWVIGPDGALHTPVQGHAAGQAVKAFADPSTPADDE